MPATIAVEASSAADVLADHAVTSARIARQFGATKREAATIGEAHGVCRMARVALGERASAEEVEAFAQAVELGDTGATLALLASR
jgi:HD superfamily phosphodiesterase